MSRNRPVGARRLSSPVESACVAEKVKVRAVSRVCTQSKEITSPPRSC